VTPASPEPDVGSSDAGDSAPSSSPNDASAISPTPAPSTGSTGSSGSTGSTGSTGGACGLCDRDWTCNNITDHWSTVGTTCVDDRTGTALSCDRTFAQGGFSKLGTWHGDAHHFTLVYPTLSGTKDVDCYP
jgi:hypothetical protein